MSTYEDNWLAHHGIKGQKWGVRRYQNEDGTLTAAGREHYGLSEGGSKQLSRQFNRDLRKLHRLEKATDVDLQKKNAEKYKKRAKIATGIGVGTAGVAAGAYGLNNHLKKAAKIAMDAKYAAADQARYDADAAVRAIWRADEQAYDAAGHWTGKGYTDRTIDRVNRRAQQYYREDNKLVGEATDIKNKFNQGAKIRKAVAIGSAAVSAGSFGYAGYAAVRSKVASRRVTDIGHQKAVQKYHDQYNKMIDQFANTPYSKLIEKKKIA